MQLVLFGQVGPSYTVRGEDLKWSDIAYTYVLLSQSWCRINCLKALTECQQEVMIENSYCWILSELTVSSWNAINLNLSLLVGFHSSLLPLHFLGGTNIFYIVRFMWTQCLVGNRWLTSLWLIVYRMVRRSWSCQCMWKKSSERLCMLSSVRPA